MAAIHTVRVLTKLTRIHAVQLLLFSTVITDERPQVKPSLEPTQIRTQLFGRVGCVASRPTPL